MFYLYLYLITVSDSSILSDWHDINLTLTIIKYLIRNRLHLTIIYQYENFLNKNVKKNLNSPKIHVNTNIVRK